MIYALIALAVAAFVAWRVIAACNEIYTPEDWHDDEF